MDVRTLIRSQSLLFAHNLVFFERRHDDLLKLQRYAHTVNIDSRSKKHLKIEDSEEKEGAILIGRDDDPAEEKTLKRFI